MSNPTSNFGWQMPTATDLVTDLPADFEVFGQAVDTALMDLKGGTTGQVLKKNTNADMDFVWGTDTAGMTNPMTTTGDTIYSSSGSTPARLGIGSSGQILSVVAGVPAWTTPSASGFVGVKVFKSATQSLANGTFTVCTFDSESFDTDGFHDNSTNNSRLTVPAGKAGKYSVYFAMTFQSNNAGQRQVQISKNAGGGTTYVTIGVSSYLGQTQGTTVLDLAVGDYIELDSYQDSGGPLNINATVNATFFGMNYLGA